MPCSGQSSKVVTLNEVKGLDTALHVRFFASLRMTRALLLILEKKASPSKQARTARRRPDRGGAERARARSRGAGPRRRTKGARGPACSSARRLGSARPIPPLRSGRPYRRMVFRKAVAG